MAEHTMTEKETQLYSVTKLPTGDQIVVLNDGTLCLSIRDEIETLDGMHKYQITRVTVVEKNIEAYIARRLVFESPMLSTEVQYRVKMWNDGVRVPVAAKRELIQAVQVYKVEFNSLENNVSNAIDKTLLGTFIEGDELSEIGKANKFLHDYKLGPPRIEYDGRVYPYIEVNKIVLS